VVLRCPFGRPAVTEQEPYDRIGEPFPTTYYLTCRHLVAAVSRLEAAGGVERWSERAVRDPELHTSLERAGEEQRKIRRRLAESRASLPTEPFMSACSARSRSCSRSFAVASAAATRCTNLLASIRKQNGGPITRSRRPPCRPAGPAGSRP